MFLVGSVGSHTILHNPIWSYTILYDPTRSYIRSYHFYDPNAILNVLVRWDSKIMRSYDPDRDFDNHDGGFQLTQLVKSLIVEWEICGSIFVYTKNRFVSCLMLKSTWFSKSGTESFNLILNITLAYKYEYNGGIWFFVSGEFKLKINKLCLRLRCLYYI